MVKVTSKPAGKFKVSGGKGGMKGFKAVGTQGPGVTSVSGSGGSKSPGAKLKGGGKGFIGGKQDGVTAVKSGITSVK
jgi:hypothetical protein